MSDTPPINLAAFEAAARDVLETMAWDYYAGGARDEITLGQNDRAWDQIALHYRVLVDASKRDLSTTVLGREIALPILAAPTAFQAMAHPEGERATVRGCGASNTIMVLSTLSTTDMETVAEAATSPWWFQLYAYRDRGLSTDLVRRAEAAGASALVLTVDAATIGTRERDVRNRFHLPPGLSARNLLAAGHEGLPELSSGSALNVYVDQLLETGLTWKDVDWLVDLTDLPIVLKGLVRPDDALRAADSGVRAVIVSNHGGRQLDTAPATATVLPRISDALSRSHPEVEILVDGGIRRGTDVIKALAFGARAVLIGRPVLWGLATGGHEGVARIFSLLRDELDEAMALCGCPDISAVTRDLVVPQDLG